MLDSNSILYTIVYLITGFIYSYSTDRYIHHYGKFKYSKQPIRLYIRVFIGIFWPIIWVILIIDIICLIIFDNSIIEKFINR